MLENTFDTNIALSPLHQDRIAFAYKSGQLDQAYFCACHFEQILADLSLMDSLADYHDRYEEVQKLRVSLQKYCMQLAQAWSQAIETGNQQLQQGIFLEQFGSAVEKCLTYSGHYTTIHPLSYILLQHIQNWYMPECSGYDLCDPTVCAVDAQQWLRTYADPLHPPLLIGIRTGGAYYIPFWAAYCQDYYSQPITSYTFRPFTINNRLLYLGKELATLPKEVKTRTNIVILDDQPDSGNTVLTLCEHLERHFQRSLQIWISSPGRLFRRVSTQLHVCRETLPLISSVRRRIWQLLGDEDTGALLQRLRTCGIELEDHSSLIVQPFTRPFSIYYQDARVLKPWNHGSLVHQKPRRINPKKTPFVLYNQHKQCIQFHAKFIGKDIFGEHEFRLLQAFHALQPQPSYYVDGYLITAYEQGLKSFKEVYAAILEQEQRHLCQDVSQYWNILQRYMRIPGFYPNPFQQLREEFQASLRAICDLINVSPLIEEMWISRHIPLSAPFPREHRCSLRTSLPYAHAYWHWQVKIEAGCYQIRRFHIDANWGGYSHMALEIASFMLENRIASQHGKIICQEIEGCKDPSMLFEDVLEQMPMALLLTLRSWLRRRKFLSPRGAQQIQSDIQNMAIYLDTILS